MTPTPQPQETSLQKMQTTPQEAVIPSEVRPWSPNNTELLRSIAADANFAEWCSNSTMPEFLASAANEIDRLSKLTTRETEAPVSEAVGWRFKSKDGYGGWGMAWELPTYLDPRAYEVQPLYTHPAPSSASAWKPGRETVARIIFPESDRVDMDKMWGGNRSKSRRAWNHALAKADRILALPTPPATEGAGE